MMRVRRLYSVTRLHAAYNALHREGYIVARGAVLAVRWGKAKRAGAQLRCDAHEGESPGSGGRHAEAWHRLL